MDKRGRPRYHDAMSIIDDIIKFNAGFVRDKKYIPYISGKFPKKKLAILSCMDTRLTTLLPAALNLGNGEAKIIKNAGAIISHPFGSVMRSLLVAVYGLGVQEIMVIGHTDCGMDKLDLSDMIEKMIRRGIPRAAISDDLGDWLHGFDGTTESIAASVKMIRTHPLIPTDVTVRGFLMDITTGGICEIG